MTETLDQRLEKLDRRTIQLETRQAEKKRQLAELERERKELEERADLLGKVEQCLLHLGTKLLGQSTKTIDQLTTAGLKIVFDDQSLEFRTSTEKYRGKTAIKFQLLEDGRQAPITDSYGGGVLAVTGLLLRVTTITVLGLKRVLVLDETLAHLSSQYIPNASKLLKKLCDDLDFTVILITHQPEFAESADNHYVAEKGKEGTLFRRERKKTKSATGVLSAKPGAPQEGS